MPEEYNSAGAPMPSSLLRQLIDAGVVSPANLMMSGAQEAWRIPEYIVNIPGRMNRAGELALNRMAGGRPIFGAATPEEEAELSPNPLLELAQAARDQRGNSQTFWRDQSSIDPDSYAGKVFQGLGGLPASLADWTPAGTALGMANSAAEGDLYGAAMQGVSRAAIGKLMQPLGNIGMNAAPNTSAEIGGMLGRQAGSGLLSGALSANEGGTPSDVLASATIGAMMPVSKNIRETKIADPKAAEKIEAYKNTVRDKFQKAVGLDPKPNRGGAARQMEEIQRGSDATLNTARSILSKGGKLPENKKEHLEALGERKNEIYNAYAPMLEQADQMGVRPNLQRVAEKILKDATNDKVLMNEHSADAQWLLNEAARLEDIATTKGGYSNAELDRVIQGYNNEIYEARQSNNIPRSGSIQNLKKLTDAMREELINTIEKPRKFTDTSNILDVTRPKIVDYPGNPEFSALRREYGAVAENEFMLDGQVRKAGNQLAPGMFKAGEPVVEALNAIAAGLHRGASGKVYALKHAYRALLGKDEPTKIMYNAARKAIEAEQGVEIKAQKGKKGIAPFGVDTSKISEEKAADYGYDVEADPFY